MAKTVEALAVWAPNRAGFLFDDEQDQLVHCVNPQSGESFETYKYTMCGQPAGESYRCTPATFMVWAEQGGAGSREVCPDCFHHEDLPLILLDWMIGND